MVTLRYRAKDGSTEALCLDFCTADLAREIFFYLDGDADLDEKDRQRLLAFGEENADHFVSIVGSLIAWRNMKALVAGVMMHHEEMIYALSDIVGAHLRTALIENLAL